MDLFIYKGYWEVTWKINMVFVWKMFEQIFL